MGFSVFVVMPSFGPVGYLGAAIRIVGEERGPAGLARVGKASPDPLHPRVCSGRRVDLRHLQLVKFASCGVYVRHYSEDLEHLYGEVRVMVKYALYLEVMKRSNRPLGSNIAGVDVNTDRLNLVVENREGKVA